ncbi:MAG: phosphatase [Betaproteobacteria bacterium RIFCSPLOWO2_12_FULL_62_13]|nr:MAG: phosphatase [Betaproteobacteria bacterium RIFCSPLOWO2_12_FULL_62_13]
MPEFDLHCHSTRSDGLLTPAALVARAAQRGVKVLALTDHDEIGGLEEAREHAHRAAISCINGVEISVSWNDQTLHVVGLHIDPANAELSAGLKQVRGGRRHRAERMAEQLEEAGISGSLDGARAYVTNPELVGRAHFARYLVERGYARDVQSVFKKYLASGKPGYVPHRWASLEQAVNWIKVSGGVAILAHPGRYKLDGTQRVTLLQEFKDLGGAGVEVISGSHMADQFAAWAQHAKRFGLLASAGSDFHGPGESRRDLGDLPDLPAGCTPVWKQF